MSEKTAIQWTNKTWNPWRGCDKVHERCKNCYMFTEQTRYGQDPSVVVRTKTWKDPRSWHRAAEQVAGIPLFVKQLGAKPYREAIYTPSDSQTEEHVFTWLNLKDKKGGNMAEWPEELQVRQFPSRL